MKTLKGAFALLLFTGFFLALSLSLFAHTASAHADFATWADRSIRVCEPAGYNTTGTCTCKACEYTRKMNTIGNMGIGDGNYSLMKPEFINDAMKAFNESFKAGGASPGETAGNTAEGNLATGSTTADIQANVTGNGGRVSRDTDTGTCPACQVAAEEAAARKGLVDSLGPSNIGAGAVIHEGVPETITLGHPFPHIMNEDPTEKGVLYAKLIGLPMPDGSRMDYGIKTGGFEY